MGNKACPVKPALIWFEIRRGFIENHGFYSGLGRRAGQGPGVGMMSGSAIAALALGAVLLLPSLAAVCRPELFVSVWLRFSRSVRPARLLAAIDLFWVTAVVHNAHLGRFEVIKTFPERLFPVLTVLLPGPLAFLRDPIVWAGIAGFFLVLRYLDELLAPRALGGLLLLLPNPVLNTLRWHPSPWRFPVTVTAYLMVLAGMTLVLGPYRWRLAGEWLRRSPFRIRAAGFAGAAWGILLTICAVLVWV